MPIIMRVKAIKPLIIFLAMIQLGLFSSCTDKCKKSNCDLVQFPDSEFQNFWNFKKGSFWVYQLGRDSSVIDTLKVVDNIKWENGPCELSGPSCIGGFTLFLNHTNVKYFPKSDLNQTFTEKWRTYFEGGFNQIRYSKHADSGLKAPSNLYFTNDHTIPEGFKISTFDQLEVNGVVYKDILRQELPNIDTSINAQNALLSMTWSKNFGIIRYQLSGNRIWKLKEKSLIQ